MNITHLPTVRYWLPYGTTCSALMQIASSYGGVQGKRLAAAIRHPKNGSEIGVNSYKTSPLQLKYAANPFKIYLHAEIEALSRATRRCKGNVEGATAFVIRLSSKGELAYAKPCDGCMAALLAFGIKEVYHS